MPSPPGFRDPIPSITGISSLLNAVAGIDGSVEWNLLNSHTGLILPLIATATGKDGQIDHCFGTTDLADAVATM